jgi:hypothetical protein
MSDYQQQTKSVCTNTNDPSCKASQAQFDNLNMLSAQVKANGEYDAPPSPSPTQAKEVVLVQGFTTLQGAYTGLFAAAALFILYGLVSVSKQRK